jgi:hypothetical protein
LLMIHPPSILITPQFVGGGGGGLDLLKFPD